MVHSRRLPALSCLLMAGLHGSAMALPADQLYARLAPSVWQVVTFDPQGKPVGIGSAVVTGKETLLTNCHVLITGRSAAIRQGNRSFGVTLQYADVDNDMCQITARSLDAPAVELGDSDKLTVGSRIYALGNPQGLELTLSDGLISALRKDAKQALSWIQISAPISPGSSGGGVFDEEGRLIGISTGGLKNGQNLNIAIPIKLASSLPERHAAFTAQLAARKKDLPPAPAPGAPALSTAPSSRPALRASGYADVEDIGKFKRVAPGDGPEANYRRFLSSPVPRAIAVSDDGHTWLTWSLVPKDKNAPREPAERAIQSCEAEYKQHCYLYAVDRTVVYQPPP